MTEDNGTPKDQGPSPADEKPVADDKPAEATNADPKPETAAAEPAKKADKPSDDEKAAKIAAAKAKAAAKKAAAKDDAPPKQPWEEKPVPPAHADAMDDGDVAALAGAVEGAVLSADSYAGEVTVTVAAETLVDCCTFLKNDQDFTFLVDLTAVDWPEREGDRFDVVYWMHRFTDSKRLRLIATTDESLATVSTVWRTADWMEREVYDMFGILFEDHPGLERILTWEGFNGHPLRKDFPLEGVDTGAAIYPDVYPPGGGPETEEADA